MIRLAVRAIESPDIGGAEAASALAHCESDDEWLLLLAAVLYSRPDLVSDAAVSRLLDCLRKPDLCVRAGEVLDFVFATPHASRAIEGVAGMLRSAAHPAAVYGVLIGCLRHAVTWARNLLDANALMDLAEAGHLKSYRHFLAANVIEPCLYAAGTVAPAQWERVLPLYETLDSAKYCNYYCEGKAGLRPDLRARFPLHEEVTRHLGRGASRVLMVHNIRDGQGDEIVRCIPLAQALLDSNPALEVVLLTRRVYLYAHPRLAAVSIEDKSSVERVLHEPFDGVIDYFEPDVKEVNCDPELEERVQAYRRRRRPFLFLSSTKGSNHFVYERMGVNGREFAAVLGLDRRRVENNYETTFRLIAEMGLSLRRGESAPATGVLAGVPWAHADSVLKALTEENRENCPMALLSPFGGTEPLKGYTSPAGVAAEIGRLVREGYFVVVMPNGTPWGTAAAARDAVLLLEPRERDRVTVGPDSASSPAERDAPFSHADTVMRLITYLVRHADLVVTVEGWMMHAAYCLGKQYRVLMLPYSHPDEWRPYVQTRCQDVFPTAWRPVQTGFSDPPLLEQPRKFLLLFLLRELGAAGPGEALEFERWAVRSSDRHVRLAAAASLAQPGNAALDEDLAALLRDPSHEVRAVAADALLGRSFDSHEIRREHLMAHRWIGQPKRDWEPVYRLGDRARPVLEFASRGDDPVVRREAAHWLRLLDFRSKNVSPNS